ncbi:ATP-dependent nuclease [Microbacterium arborescens]|uniref:ATP-dependent nuclease n=1 Tax=Microbacterium arborescens TaxID=33883 RepID=UPI0025A206D1|nr:ATP-binding protein [Microbacterium arborescens]WJM15301.1 ATP-binding protein [Microbacterium arborescens]
MTFSASFECFELASGQVVTLSEKGVTCVVGANNSGKSQLLKDLVESVRQGEGDVGHFGVEAKARPLVAKSRFRLSDLDDDAIAAWLHRNAVGVDGGHPTNISLPPGALQVGRDGIAPILRSAEHGSGLQYLTEAVVRRIPAGGLTSYAEGTLRTDMAPESLRNWLIRRLMEDGALEREFTQIMNDLFDIPCFVDRVTFPPRLKAGRIEVEIPPANNISKEYADAVTATRNLDEQGDGMRSFAGLALIVLALSPQVLLLDEPETFFHPAQARAVGRWLSREAQGRAMQVIVATHDRDLLVGLLEGGEAGVEIIRLRRGPDGASVKKLSTSELERYRLQPSLRYSTVLQGLFHQRVVICEGDADCRFYSAAADELATSRDIQSVADNTLFVPSSGDGGIAKLGALLGDLDVSVSAIVDFDTLERVHVLKSIVRAFGQEWDDELESNWTDIQKHAKGVSDFWTRLKNGGLAGAPAGNASRSVRAFIGALASKGVILVPVGELEDFHRDVGKGPEWINAALDADAHLDPVVRQLIEAAVPELAGTGTAR